MKNIISLNETQENLNEKERLTINSKPSLETLGETQENKKSSEATPEKNRESAFDELERKAKDKNKTLNSNETKTIEDLVVDELNKKHAAMHTDQFYILTEKPGTIFKGIDFTLESKSSFLNTYENQVVVYPDGKTKTKAQIWLKHENRRTYNGITFDPEKKAHENGLYNIWKGFAVEPKQGDCSLFKKHIREVICGGNVKYFEYVWNWLSHLVQKPQELSPGLILKGEGGIGKNTFVNVLGIIFGQHYLPLDSIDQFLGSFNFHLKNAVLIHGNESIWGGDKRQLGKLKAMVTEEHCVIEGKGKDQITLRNFKHLILSSNEDWPVHLDRDNRRFLVLNISNQYKDDETYFKPLREEIKNGGTEAFLYELLETDLGNFNVWKLPENLEAFEIKMLSAATTEKYLYLVLCEGSFDISLVEQSGKWNERPVYEVTQDCAFSDYKGWCELNNVKVLDASLLGKAISRLIPSTATSRPRPLRKTTYTFPSLAKAREEFQKAYKVSGEIWI